MYKCIHDFTTTLLCDMIVVVYDINEWSTRNKYSLNVYISKPDIQCYWNKVSNGVLSVITVYNLVKGEGQDASHLIYHSFKLITQWRLRVH